VKIYVAGASSEMPLIETLMRRLREAGHTITHDWTFDVRNAGSASPDDAVVRKTAARKDLRGVAESEVTWLVKPAETSTSTGAWVELGYGIGLKDAAAVHGIEFHDAFPMLVASGGTKKCIFADLVDREFEEHEEALAFILRLGAPHGD
jgi:hypothetical protein